MSAPQVTQAGVSCLALLAGYVAYSTFAVPLIEGADPQQTAASTQAAQHYEDPTARFQGLIDPLFPEGSWEREEAKILKTDRLLLLLKDYRALENNRLHISPCTIVLLPEPGEPSQRAWVVQAIEGAIIEFDQRMDLRRGQLGGILAAYVPGSVQIHGLLPEGGERVEISSRNLQFDTHRIWTPHEVEFRVGKSYGSGRDLTIVLNPREGSDTGRGQGRLPDTVSAHVRSIELVEMGPLHIDPSDSWGGGLDPAARGVPIDITCAGSLFADVISGIARLSKTVRVARSQSDEVFDRLTCDQLDVGFAWGSLQRGAVAGGGDEPSLTRVAARGSPARLATCLQPGEPRHEITSPEFAYEFTGLGRFSAEGPGQYETIPSPQAAAGAEQLISVQWQRRLHWTATEEGGRLQLVGPASCQAPSYGRIQANSLGLELALARGFVREERGKWKPERIWGEGEVQIETAPLLAQARELQVQFVDASPAPPAAAAVPAADAGPNLRSADPAASQASHLPDTRFQLTGGILRLEVARGEQSLELRQLAIDEGVRCLEVRGEGQQEVAGVELRGDQLHLQRPAVNQETAVIVGSPALIRARQIDVTGTQVHLDRGTNRIWVEGAGSATMPLPPTLAAQMPNQVPSVFLSWEDQMEFDGQTVTCGQQVTVQGPTQRIRCGQLSAVLQQRIDLSESSLPVVAVDRVEASRGVTVENRTLGSQGLESIDTGQIDQLTIWHQTGRLVGTGAGWLETVRHAGEEGVPSLPAAARPGSPESADPTQLIYLRVSFQQGLEGNIHKRQIDFIDRVRATYGPVTDWHSRILVADPAALPAGALMLGCDRLSVFQLVKRYHAGALPIELMALGNVTVEGGEFAAQAHRISYDQSKDQLVLDGDGRADVRLWRRGNEGKRVETQAARIQFWPGSNRVKVDSFKGMILGEQLEGNLAR